MTRVKAIIIILFICVVTMGVATKARFAQAADDPGGDGGTGNTITNPALGKDLSSKGGLEYFSDLIPSLVTLIFVIGAIIFFFMLLIGGIRWMTSAGDKASLEAARGTIVGALIGIVILFSAFAIVGMVELFFGIDILSIDIESLFIR